MNADKLIATNLDTIVIGFAALGDNCTCDRTSTVELGSGVKYMQGSSVLSLAGTQLFSDPRL